MREKFPLIVSILLLVHLAFGCCWHHAHACAANRCQTPAAYSEPCGCEHAGVNQTDANLHPLRDRSGDPAPAPTRHKCEGEQCTFLRSARSRVEQGQFYASIVPLKFARYRDATKTAVARALRLTTAEFPGLRVHLRCSVLLI